MSKKAKIALYIALFLVIVVIIIYPKLNLHSDEAPHEDSAPASNQSETNVLPVNVRVVSPQPIDRFVQVTGSLMANEEVNLTAERAGIITKINFKEGESVKKGQILVYLNDSELQAQLQRLQYNLELRQQQESRQKQLLDKEAISQEEYDIALTELNTIKAEIKQVEAEINNSRIVAPFDGIIGLRSVSEGGYISPNESIARLIDLDPIKLEFSVPETYVEEININDIVYFSSKALQDEVKARVYAVEPHIDMETRTVKVRAITANKSQKFLPGMFVNIRIVFGTEENALMIPSEALIPEQNGFKVYKKQSGAAMEQRVKIGRRTPDEVQITEGINSGDTLITSGILQLRDGMKISVANL